MKKITRILIFILCVLSISVANPIYIETYPLKKLDSTIININEPIKSIWLVLDDSQNADVKEAYNYSDIFEDGEEAMKYMFCFEDEVDPFSEEDYVFNDNFDKKNYIVYYWIDYEYHLDKHQVNVDEKLKNKDELIQKLYIKSDPNVGKDTDIITCKRKVVWSANKLTDIREIPVSEIIDGKLNIVLTDFSGLEKSRWSSGRGNKGYSIRFEKENGEYLTFSLNTSNVIEGTGTTNGERKEIIDYTKHSYDRFASNSTIVQSPSFIVANSFTIIIGALVVVAIIVVVIIIILKTKNVGKSNN